VFTPEPVPRSETATERRARLERDRMRLEAFNQRRRLALEAEERRAAAELQARLDRQRLEADAKVREQEAATKRLEDARKADEDRRKRQEEEAQQARERLYQVGMQVTAMGAGVVLGKKLATGIERRHIAHLNARANQLTQVGYQASQLLKAGANGYISQA